MGAEMMAPGCVLSFPPRPPSPLLLPLATTMAGVANTLVSIAPRR